jgi:hypothetical protein
LHYPAAPPALELIHIHFGPSSDDPFRHIAVWVGAAQKLCAIRSLEMGILQRQSLPSVCNLVRTLGPELHALSLNFIYHVTAGACVDIFGTSCGQTRRYFLILHLQPILKHTSTCRKTPTSKTSRCTSAYGATIRPRRTHTLHGRSSPHHDSP